MACEYSFIKNSILHLPLNKPAPELTSLQPPLKAAIYVLVNPARLSQLATMLQQLHTNFNHKYRYPIVLFHDQALSVEQQALITRHQEWSWVQFVAIDLSLAALEPELNADEIPESTECAPTRIGYRHMCRFHAIEASKKLSAMGFEWHWRLDDDSKLNDPIGYDVFRMMATNQMLYGYIDVVQEETKCYTSLWELSEQHLADTRTEPTFFYEWPQGAVFYNNFEISHGSVWESADVQAWMRAVRESRGIYLYRWGDAPIRTLAVSMFVDPKRVHRSTMTDLASSNSNSIPNGRL